MADALKKNKVREIISSSFVYCSFYLTQKLIRLNLEHNEITEKGVEHLANALRNNTVRESCL